LLASTREGEEEMLLDALAGDALEALVVIVPRHPQRFEEVAALAAGNGFPVGRRSRGDVPRPQDRVYVGDTMGEMTFYYAAADVAVIGGSFMPLGGQNLIEACATATPVVFGPSMHNFAEASTLARQAGAAIQARDAADAVRLARALLDDSPRREGMGEAGRRLCLAHRGAAQKHVVVCKQVLERRDAGAAAPVRAPGRG